MFNNYMINPSLIILYITGFIILSIIIILLLNFNKFMKHRFYEKVGVILMISIAISSHGLIHLGAEKQYGSNYLNLFK